jgi:hypothetical protein
MQIVAKASPLCRRRTSRFEVPDGTYVYWRCAGMDDVSKVRDLGVGGLFLATEKPRQEGLKVKIEFLVQEGQIRAEAVVLRSEGVNGLGLKFTAVSQEDRQRLASLLNRVRSYRHEVRKTPDSQRAQ